MSDKGHLTNQAHARSSWSELIWQNFSLPQLRLP